MTTLTFLGNSVVLNTVSSLSRHAVTRSVLSVLLAIALGSPCAAQIDRIYKSRPIRNTPLDPRTLIPPSKETHSDLQVVQPPYIDENGNVWPGRSDTGDRASRPVAKAKIGFPVNKTDAYWVSNYSNALGTPSPRRAPRKYDRTEQLGREAAGEPTAGTSGKIETESGSTSIRTQINPVTGQVVRQVLRNGSVKSASVVGQAKLQTSGNGQRRWVHGNQSVVAQQQGGVTGNQTPEQQLAIGILQILDAAAKKKQQKDDD